MPIMPQNEVTYPQALKSKGTAPNLQKLEALNSQVTLQGQVPNHKHIAMLARSLTRLNYASLIS